MTLPASLRGAWDPDYPQPGCSGPLSLCWLLAGVLGIGLQRLSGSAGLPNLWPRRTLSTLLFTAQRREMSSATMETRGSPSPLSWHQVSLLWWVVTGWGLLLWGNLCIFRRLDPCHISLLRLLSGCWYILRHAPTWSTCQAAFSLGRLPLVLNPSMSTLRKRAPERHGAPPPHILCVGSRPLWRHQETVSVMPSVLCGRGSVTGDACFLARSLLL